MPARYLFMDEVDGYPGDVEGEGDPILLAERRSATFARRRKVRPTALFAPVMTSTPPGNSFERTVLPESLLRAGATRALSSGTSSSCGSIRWRELRLAMRYFYVPCPSCGHSQPLRFSQLRWEEGKPENAQYCCEDCDYLISEHQKTEMLNQGYWQATTEGDGQTQGYHLSIPSGHAERQHLPLRTNRLQEQHQWRKALVVHINAPILAPRILLHKIHQEQC
jgi:phage terminase large subunit GpA-like protein